MLNPIRRCGFFLSFRRHNFDCIYPKETKDPSMDTYVRYIVRLSDLNQDKRMRVLWQLRQHNTSDRSRKHVCVPVHLHHKLPNTQPTLSTQTIEHI